ncbi:hypothetical protein K1719_014268 [Acacia pycnantha]|nr:hypothetical protein K1719_014268 [Acacia pycnantha]
MEATYGELLLDEGPNQDRKLQSMQANFTVGFVQGRCSDAVVSEAVVLGSRPVARQSKQADLILECGEAPSGRRIG